MDPSVLLKGEGGSPRATVATGIGNSRLDVLDLHDYQKAVGLKNAVLFY